MKKIIVQFFTTIICITACSQQSENNKNSNLTKDHEMSDTLITSKNFAEKVAQNVKHYEKEPVWFFWIDNKVNYEMYVNDLPIEKYYESGGLGNRITFNKAILKSGTQNFKLRIFPRDENVEETYHFTITIGRYFTNDRHNSEEITEIKFQKSDFKKIGENVYETIYEFEAEVPYENKGWSEGQDLRKYDPKELEKAVLAFYQKMWDIYNDKSKIDAQFPLIYNREVESAQNRYLSKADIQEVLDELLRPYTNSTYEMQPIENYKMVYYGDGKMIALELKSLDVRLRGKSALWAKYKDGNSTLGYSQGLLLYLPQGKTLENGLEIIR